MTAGKQAGQDLAPHLALADDDASNLGVQSGNERRGVLEWEQAGGRGGRTAAGGWRLSRHGVKILLRRRRRRELDESRATVHHEVEFMQISELLLPEFDTEIAVTRTVLERVPDDRGEWKPHAKSFPLGHLAQLVARLPGWVNLVLDRTTLDIAPVNGPGFPGYSLEKTATLLSELDTNAAAAHGAIARASDEDYAVTWILQRGGTTMMSSTRYVALRSMVFNHLVHHRAQLALYLRMLDLRVPSMYGPTADDQR
jgi:uncharacterized damage-inducible protein DinB